MPVLVLMAVGISFYLLWFIAKKDHIAFQDIMPWVLMICACGYASKRILGFKAEYIRQLKATPGYGQMAVWTINEEGYEERLSSHHAFIAWKDVCESKVTPDGVMIFLPEGTFNWLPKRAFSESDYSRFLGFIASKTKHSKIS